MSIEQIEPVRLPFYRNVPRGGSRAGCKTKGIAGDRLATAMPVFLQMSSPESPKR